MSQRSGRRSVHFGEFNLLMNGSTYLPLVSGLLQARAQQSELVRDNFDFAPFHFHTDSLQAIVDSYDDPKVATFSMLMWNAELSLAVARALKDRYPDCLIVFGGANVPHHPQQFMQEHPFIDLCVRSEGEDVFTEILERLAQAPNLAAADFDGIANSSWLTPQGEFRHCLEERAFQKDLDVYPSPYLEGVYEELFQLYPDLDFQAIIETNRGCPFRCTFCYWGKGGLSRKYRFHSIERVEAEIDWMAAHEIRYVFNADSNFGMHRRDQELAEILVRKKQETGYPEKFRTCYGKNTDEKIFAIGKLFHDHQLEKGITISYQSVDAGVQKNIKRDNIRLSCAEELQRKFNDSGVPVYTELILGLPGESYDSWLQGIDKVLGSGLKNQLFMYICQVYPNTDLGDPRYQESFGIETQRITLKEIHGLVRAEDRVEEKEEIVIATKAMSNEDWRRALVLSWVTMSLHSLKLGFFVMAWLVDRFGQKHSSFLEYYCTAGRDAERYPMISRELAIFDAKIERILAGEGRGCVMPDYGKIYWDEEEASFLRVSEDYNAFYQDLGRLVQAFLAEQGCALPAEELADVLAFQQASMPMPRGAGLRLKAFDHKVVNYFDTLFSSAPQALEPGSQHVEFSQTAFGGDLPRFARESILWGRKSGTMLCQPRIADAVVIPRQTSQPPASSKQPSKTS